ncbi:glycosyltransferase [bacterium]|nr:glycosyltransferase [bacterium]
MQQVPVTALCSIYAQTTTYEFSLAISSLFSGFVIPSELIVVIDGPISHDLDFVLDQLDFPTKVRKLTLQHNHGLGLALSKALMICTYKYIFRFDTDDVNAPHRLYYQYLFMLNNNSVDVLGSYISEQILVPSIVSSLKRVPTHDYSIKSSFHFRNSINHPSSLFKLQSVLSAGSYQDCRYFEDYLLWLTMRDRNAIFANLSLPLVITTRHSFAERRSGLSYFRAELIFVLKYFNTKRHSNLTILVLFIRAFTRLLPFQNFINKFLPWRQ